MYRSCIFCSAALGSNDSIERFPVGKSLAFDGEKGRLWAVCPRCARWNLAPIEERWEAIEDAERLFRDTRLRVQHENIGLSRLPDGTSLIRIGQAPTGELAAWRYGREMQRRRRRANLQGYGRIFAPLGIVGAFMAAPVTLAGIAAMQLYSVHSLYSDQLDQWWAYRRARRLAYRVAPEHSPTGRAIHLQWRELELARVALDGDGRVAVELLMESRDLPHGREPVVLTGPSATALVGVALAEINAAGARQRDLDLALDDLSAHGGAEPFLRELATELPMLTVPRLVREHPFRRQLAAWDPPVRVRDIRTRRTPSVGDYAITSLALEMALHEETERRALEGELAGLAEMWKQAEEIAAIADRLPDVPAPDPPRLRAEA